MIYIYVNIDHKIDYITKLINQLHCVMWKQSRLGIIRLPTTHQMKHFILHTTVMEDVICKGCGFIKTTYDGPWICANCGRFQIDTSPFFYNYICPCITQHSEWHQAVHDLMPYFIREKYKLDYNYQTIEKIIDHIEKTKYIVQENVINKQLVSRFMPHDDIDTIVIL